VNAEPEIYPPEALSDEEPRYLRRQKPLEIRRRKFNRRTWPAIRRWSVVGAATLGAGFIAYSAVHFLLFSPRVQLASYDQIEISGNHYVGRAAVTEKFAEDLGKSVVRVPLDTRRAELEAIPWVEDVSVQRILPGGLRVDLVERTPVAFLRSGTELSLVDLDGVILERPTEADFAFPVISGLSESMPLADRAARMKQFDEFLKDLNLAQPGASDQVSEVDLSDAHDVRATLAGLGDQGQAPLQVRFGETDFVNKYRLLVENIASWRASVGRVESVDLRFSRQVVVNPESNRSARASASGTVVARGQ
jgi:cell division protein FtsQ